MGNQNKLIPLATLATSTLSLKGNAQFNEEVTFEFWWISNKAIIGVGNIAKAAKLFFTKDIKTHNYSFCGQCFLISSWFLGVTQKYGLRVSFKLDSDLQ